MDSLPRITSTRISNLMTLGEMFGTSYVIDHKLDQHSDEELLLTVIFEAELSIADISNCSV